MRSSDISNTYTCDIDHTTQADGPPYPTGWKKLRVARLTDATVQALDICPNCIAATDTVTLGKFKAALLGSS